MKAYVEWRYSSTIPDLGTRCKSVVGLMNRPLVPWYPLDKRLGGDISGKARRKETTRKTKTWVDAKY
jgi:hypothetical protein